MGRYTPSLTVNRRHRLVAANRPETVRLTMLGIFMMLLGFFVALVAWSTPNDAKSVELLNTLQATFKPVDIGKTELRDPAPVPSWMTGSGEGQAAPLETLRELYPDIFVQSDDPWGSIELQFTPDRFQSFMLANPELAQAFMDGFKSPRTDKEDYMLEATIGLRDDRGSEARALRQKTERELLAMGVHPSRLLMGYDNELSGIVLRVTPANRYEGAL